MKLDLIVDLFAGIVFIPVIVTSIALFLLPDGKHSGLATLFGVDKVVWTNIHTVTGFLFIALVVIHLVLHYKYIYAIIKR
ncbi:MAG: DUF4405 domain-containing protein [Candidatus Diapherotrites archaeon]|nr:DUF4405 domain-containing protein [Candidatus Diapherotrites archaeon]